MNEHCSFVKFKWMNGWWYSYSSEKHESIGMIISNIRKNNSHVRNQQPGMNYELPWTTYKGGLCCDSRILQKKTWFEGYKTNNWLASAFYPKSRKLPVPVYRNRFTGCQMLSIHGNYQHGNMHMDSYIVLATQTSKHQEQNHGMQNLAQKMKQGKPWCQKPHAKQAPNQYIIDF